MPKLTLTDLSSLSNQTSAITLLNNNNTAVEVALEKTLSRDGTAPNAMEASLDMNSQRIINLPAPVGSLFTRTDGGASTTLYVKESGTGNTGWVAK